MSEFRRNLLVAMNKAEPPITKDYLTIVALEDGLTAKLSVNACEYCVDGNGIWKTLPADTETEVVNSGQTLSFRGNLIPDSTNGIGTFTVNKYFNLKGNCMSLLFGDNGKDSFSLSGKDCAFKNLFSFNGKLVDASEFVLQATILARECYNNLFSKCTSLVASPKLPAIIMYSHCYEGMFYRCMNLTEAPELPAMSLGAYCYNAMFVGCISLTTSPNLPAITLANYCYFNMFQSCTNLIEAPALFARIMHPSCYYGMFNGCRKINYIKMFATDISATSCLTNWVVGVALTGTFVKNKEATWDIRGVSGIPDGWEVITE